MVSAPLTSLLGVALALASTDVVPPRLSTCSDLAAEAVEHVGEPVAVQLQFHSLVESWNPFLTRFGTGQFVALQAWTDEQLPWVREDYDNPAVRFYVRRGGELETFVRGLARHDRVRATCVVREIFAGRLWAEVVDAERLDESIPEGTVLHVLRALDLMERGAWELADSELDRALLAPVPAHAWDEISAIRRRCLDGMAAEQARKRTRSQR